MNVRKLIALLDLMEERGVAEIEVRSWFRTIRLSRAAGPNVSFFSAPGTPADAALPTAAAPAASLPEAAAAEAEVEDEDLLVVNSPMVGTFYRAPAPDAEPFVEEGTRVSRGQVVCIIEAMKIMNEIESEYAGTVVRLHAENGGPVEYGQPLFSLKPA
ncbi:MAG: acetyl-CoA carboxylase biotin carboxyl carrier protein [Candidatus Coatesbacteria bacterium]|nr:MAG: acetyl-CoA carboxylase biotin carboxyl carrier protein [Candidatus Coatesbacteria bacterium]